MSQQKENARHEAFSYREGERGSKASSTARMDKTGRREESDKEGRSKRIEETEKKNWMRKYTAH